MRQETCAFVTLLFYRIFAPTETIESHGRTGLRSQKGRPSLPRGIARRFSGTREGTRQQKTARSAIKHAIQQKESASTIRRLALSEGMTSLRQDAVRKVVAGQTTPEEIMRAVYLEE